MVGRLCFAQKLIVFRSKGKIKKAKCQVVVERGEIDSIYTHVFIGIQHNSKVHLNIGAIQDKVCSDMV